MTCTVFFRLLLACLAVSILAGAPPKSLAGQAPPQAEEKVPAIVTAKPRQPAAGDDELRKLLIARYNAAVAEMQVRYQEFQIGRGTFVTMVETARRLRNSELELSDQPADQIAVRERFLEFAQAVEKIQQARLDAGRVSSAELENARYLRLDAEIQLLKARRKAKAAK